MEKKDGRGKHGNQGRKSNESKGKSIKVMYPKRVDPAHIPLITEFIKTLALPGK